MFHKIPNIKFQISGKFQYPKLKISNTPQVCFGHWRLGFEILMLYGAWNL
jgi:hypothetical protein